MEFATLIAKLLLSDSLKLFLSENHDDGKELQFYLIIEQGKGTSLSESSTFFNEDKMLFHPY